MTCCGSCGSKSTSSVMEWGQQGYRIRQDETFMVPAPSEWAGWKTGTGLDASVGLQVGSPAKGPG